MFQSLGDLLISVLLFAWLIYPITTHFKLKIANNLPAQLTFALISFTITLLICYVISRIINSMVLDSNIALDMSNLFNFNDFSVISFIIFFLLFFSLVILSNYLFAHINIQLISYRHWLLIFL